MTKKQKINLLLFYIIGAVFIGITIALRHTQLVDILGPIAVLVALILLGIPVAQAYTALGIID